jgi:hypothetical protein
MHTFTHTPDPANEFDLIRVEMSSNAVSLDDMCELFERYLKATGFVFDGQVNIVQEEPKRVEEKGE